MLHPKHVLIKYHLVHQSNISILLFLPILAYKVRSLRYPEFWSKVRLEINISSNCSAWDINMANAVCRIEGFPEAEAVLQGEKLIGNDSCVSSQENNSTCNFFEKQTSSSCNVSNETVVVCKGNKLSLHEHHNLTYTLSVRDQFATAYAICTWYDSHSGKGLRKGTNSK